ncbi:MAG: hypothetical protein IT383_23330 [Deltaproteobacteria bacterium]|nr:hypothetical protein [Deltaproteobacteria bacterium]
MLVVGGEEIVYTENAAWTSSTGAPFATWEFAGVISLFYAGCVPGELGILCMSSTRDLAGAGGVIEVTLDDSGALVERSLGTLPLPTTAAGIVRVREHVFFLGGVGGSSPVRLKTVAVARVDALLRTEGGS